ncbi:carboxymuconolactone decarboxylase family protein [Streptomonospora litoralis]|uniref:Carboxymuconolactone decarboxylase family protein n=1 Tax=Streptomonospora litoralis TaxID=2498135 RepID=A0A4P6PW70_9ACTN|nr:carboxymuconolactone decarboxylase family protein [Streptomonospora litoralis]QBI52313.1 Carboxymuconolactone decarboxylase family protein [Streptomonospora litoralis]
MRHGRIHWYSPDELSAEQRAIYDGVLAKYGSEPPFELVDADGRLHGPFNAMLAAPGVGAALQHLSAAVGARTSLSARIREIAILTVATARASAFEWSAHRGLAAEAGLAESEIAALGGHATPESFGPADRAALDFTRALLRDRDTSAACHTAAEEHFGEAGVVELVTLVGYYDLLATLLRALRVPLPED